MNSRFPTSATSRSVVEVAQDTGTPLGRLLLKARKLDQISKILEEAIGPQLAAKVGIVSFQAECLILVTANAATAAHLRRETEGILQRMKQQTAEFKGSIEIRIDPEFRKR